MAIPIAFFCSVASMDTGMPICTIRLIKHFAAHPSYQVHLICGQEGALSSAARSYGAQVHVVNFNRLRGLHRPLLLAQFLFTLLQGCFRLRMLAKRYRFAFVHFSDFIDAPFYPALAATSTRVIAHLRLTISQWPLRLGYKLWSKIFTDRVICITNAVRHHAALSGSRAPVIYDPGPDPAIFGTPNSYPDLLRLPPNTLRIITIGKILKIKGYEYFLEMARRLKDLTSLSVHFIIVGDKEAGHESYYEAIQRLINDLGLRDVVSITGVRPQSDVAALLAHAHIFTHLPHCQEGFGGVILEAMAMGLPVVVFNSGGTAESFDRSCGFLIPQYDVAAATQAVKRLAEDAPLRSRMGVSAQLFVNKNFDAQLHFAHIEELYTALLSPPSPDSAPQSVDT
jgi:glycosyltransferase involved in cell wall biosynthesis